MGSQCRTVVVSSSSGLVMAFHGPSYGLSRECAMKRENIEMYLKACGNYGLKEQDLFQVNDLYENKNLYMVVDNLYALGGMAQKKSWEGPALGVKVASENKRNFDDDVLKAGQSMIGLQYGTNKGASQAGMTPYGASRQIRLEDQLAYKMNLAEH